MYIHTDANERCSPDSTSSSTEAWTGMLFRDHRFPWQQRLPRLWTRQNAAPLVGQLVQVVAPVATRTRKNEQASAMKKIRGECWLHNSWPKNKKYELKADAGLGQFHMNSSQNHLPILGNATKYSLCVCHEKCYRLWIHDTRVMNRIIFLRPASELYLQQHLLLLLLLPIRVGSVHWRSAPCPLFLAAAKRLQSSLERSPVFAAQVFLQLSNERYLSLVTHAIPYVSSCFFKIDSKREREKGKERVRSSGQSCDAIDEQGLSNRGLLKSWNSKKKLTRTKGNLCQAGQTASAPSPWILPIFAPK